MTLIDELEAIYATIPSAECKGLCANTCTLIPATPQESERMRRYSGRKTVTPSDRDLATLLRKERAGTATDADVPLCPLLRHGRCTAYIVRPTICRVWGVTEDMPCPHGCAVTPRMMTSAETKAVFAAVDDLAERWVRGER